MSFPNYQSEVQDEQWSREWCGACGTRFRVYEHCLLLNAKHIEPVYQWAEVPHCEHMCHPHMRRRLLPYRGFVSDDHCPWCKCPGQYEHWGLQADQWIAKLSDIDPTTLRSGPSRHTSEHNLLGGMFSHHPAYSAGPQEAVTLEERMQGLTTSSGIGDNRTQSRSHSVGQHDASQGKRRVFKAWTHKEKQTLLEKVEAGMDFPKIASIYFSKGQPEFLGAVRSANSCRQKFYEIRPSGVVQPPPKDPPQPPVLNEQERIFLDSINVSTFPRCSPCFKDRRRCDKKTPKCSRCAEKSLDCSKVTQDQLQKDLREAARSLNVENAGLALDGMTNQREKRAFTAEENEKLLELAARKNSGEAITWGAMGAQLDNRLGSTVKRHLEILQNPALKKPPPAKRNCHEWTLQEDQIILKSVASQPPFKVEEIRRLRDNHFSHRTIASVRQHYDRLEKQLKQQQHSESFTQQGQTQNPSSHSSGQSRHAKPTHESDGESSPQQMGSRMQDDSEPAYWRQNPAQLGFHSPVGELPPSPGHLSDDQVAAFQAFDRQNPLRERSSSLGITDDHISALQNIYQGYSNPPQQPAQQIREPQPQQSVTLSHSSQLHPPAERTGRAQQPKGPGKQTRRSSQSNSREMSRPLKDKRRKE